MSLPGPTQLGSFRKNLLQERRTLVNIVAYQSMGFCVDICAQAAEPHSFNQYDRSKHFMV